jgi:hypothetical protein
LLGSPGYRERRDLLGFPDEGVRDYVVRAWGYVVGAWGYVAAA